MNNVVLGLYVSWVITNTFVSNHCTSNVWAGVIVVWDVKGPNTRDLKVWIILIFEWKSANASLQCSHIYDVLLIPISSLLYSVAWSALITGVGSWCCPGPRLTASVRCWPLSQPSLRAAPASSEAPANNHLYHTPTTLPSYTILWTPIHYSASSVPSSACTVTADCSISFISIIWYDRKYISM